MAENILWLVLLFVVAFLLGSIPWGVIISKAFFKKDIRNEGSGNIGATNAMRSMGKKGGVSVFLLDFAKGLLAGFVGMLFSTHFLDAGDPGLAKVASAIALMGAAWGHIFSPWLGFKGGKGISVAFGCMFFSFSPLGAMIVLLCFLVLVFATKRISCGSLAGAVACIALGFYYYWGSWIAIVLCSLVGLTVIWAHRANIGRLIRGEEPKIGSKKKAASSNLQSDGTAASDAADADCIPDPIAEAEAELDAELAEEA